MASPYEAWPRQEPRRLSAAILSVGRYVEKKGFNDLIESCRLLRDRGRHFECLIVGGGPLGVSPAEANQVARHQLADRVKLLGPRSQAEVMQLLAMASVFALACVPEAGGGSDNLPTVIVEAMAAGAPTVSTTVAGIPEMISDGSDGLLVPPHSPDALAGAIDRLLQNATLRAEIGRCGQATARRKFAIEGTVRELKRLLVRLAPVLPPPAALQSDPTLKEECQGFWRSLLSALWR